MQWSDATTPTPQRSRTTTRRLRIVPECACLPVHACMARRVRDATVARCASMYGTTHRDGRNVCFWRSAAAPARPTTHTPLWDGRHTHTHTHALSENICSLLVCVSRACHHNVFTSVTHVFSLRRLQQSTHGVLRSRLRLVHPFVSILHPPKGVRAAASLCFNLWELCTHSRTALLSIRPPPHLPHTQTDRKTPAVHNVHLRADSYTEEQHTGAGGAEL